MTNFKNGAIYAKRQNDDDGTQKAHAQQKFRPANFRLEARRQRR